MGKPLQKLLVWLTLFFGVFTTVLTAQPSFAQTQQLALATSGSVTIQTDLAPSLSQQLAEKAYTSWPWYLVRASGLVAAVLMVILILSGIGQVTGYTFRFLEPITAWATHRALGIALAGAVFLHLFGLLFDKFVPFNISELLIPFKSPYKPVTIFGQDFGSLYIALGVLAFYLLIVVVLSSLLWVDKKPRTWKILHLLSYVLMAFVFTHALLLGTDLSSGWMNKLWIFSGIAIVIAIFYRLRRTNHAK